MCGDHIDCFESLRTQMKSLENSRTIRDKILFIMMKGGKNPKNSTAN